MPKFFDRFNTSLIEKIETKFKREYGIKFSKDSRKILEEKLKPSNITDWIACIQLFEITNLLGVESLRWLIDTLEQGLTPEKICNVLNQLNNVQLLNLEGLSEIKGKTAYGKFLSYLNDILNEVGETVPLQSKKRVIQYLLSLDTNQLKAFCARLPASFEDPSFQAALKSYLEDLEFNINRCFMEAHKQGRALPELQLEFEEILNDHLNAHSKTLSVRRNKPTLEEWLDIAERLQIIYCKLKEQNIGEDKIPYAMHHLVPQ
jgi:hypothetical protein